MSTLGSLQETFSDCLATLLNRAMELPGYRIRLKELYRPPETAELYEKQGRGIKNSVHCDGLAIDLYVTINGVLSDNYQDYLPLANFWKKLNVLCRWGGDFTKYQDIYHFSFEYNGRM